MFRTRLSYECGIRSLFFSLLTSVNDDRGFFAHKQMCDYKDSIVGLREEFKWLIKKKEGKISFSSTDHGGEAMPGKNEPQLGTSWPRQLSVDGLQASSLEAKSHLQVSRMESVPQQEPDQWWRRPGITLGHSRWWPGKLFPAYSPEERRGWLTSKAWSFEARGEPANVRVPCLLYL